MNRLEAARGSRNSSGGSRGSSDGAAADADDEADTGPEEEPLHAYAGITKNPRWSKLPDHLQPTESLHIPHHREKRFVPKSTKLSLLLCKNMKQVWRKKLLLFTELLLPILFVCVLSCFVATMESQINPDPITYSSFGFDAIPLKSCFKLLLAPKCDFTEEIVRRMILAQERYKLINGSAYAFVAADAWTTEDLESGGICAMVKFHTNGTSLGDTPYIFPEKVEYQIRLPAIQQEDDVNKAQLKVDSLWDTNKMQSDRLRVGPRNRKDKHGGSPGYYSEGFLFLQRKIDYIILEMIFAREKVSQMIGPDGPTRYAAIDKVHPLLQRFPHPPYQNANLVQLLTEHLATLLFVCYMPLFIVNTWLLVKERQAGAKGHLSYYNINPWHCWLAWIVYKMIFYSMALIPVVALLMVAWNYDVNRALINLSSAYVIYFFLWTYILNVLSMSCALSTWFTNATTACLMAGAYWIISYIPVIFVDRNIELFSLLLKYMYCFSPNTGLMIGFQIIGMAEFNSDGIDWDTLFAEEFDLGHVIVIFLASVIARILLAVYFEHLFPTTNQYGFRIPWCYFFTLWWWKGELPRNKHNTMPKIGTSQLERDHPELFEHDFSNNIHRRELSLSSVTKVIGGVTVLSRINLEFLEGEIFAVLGAAKSGKSTLFSICTARMGTTSGVASLKKRDIGLNTAYGRTNIGYCTDTNCLYDYLTVEEHISFFVQLKGVLHVADAFEEIDRLVAALDLEEFRKVRAENLTFGQKRTVHIAIAFSGGSKVVILDEPTLQMTIPESRTAWRFLDAEKKRRCIILLTKSAEEASYIADRMTILSNGEIQCRGTAAFVRSKFGGGYHLNITKVRGSTAGARVVQMVSNMVPDVLLEAEDETQLRMNLPSECSPYFEQLFDTLDNNKKNFGIADMNISYTAMEEVHQKVDLQSSVSHVNKEQRRHSKMYSLTSQAEFVHMKPTNIVAGGLSILINQYRLLFFKDVRFTFRRWVWHIGPLLIVIGIIVYGVGDWTAQAFRYELKELPIDLIVEKVQDDIHNEPKCLVKCTDYFTDHAAFCTALRQTIESYNLTLERAADSPMEKQLLKSYKKGVMTQITPYMLAVEVRFRPSDILITVYFNNKIIHSPPVAVNILSNLLLRRMKVTTTGVNFSTNRISASNYPLPYTVRDKLKLTDNYQSTGFIVGVTLAWAVLFCFPNMIICFIQEKKFKHLQIIAGVNLFLFWLSKFVWNFFVWILVALVGVTTIVLIVIRLQGLYTLQGLIALLIFCSCYGFCIFSIVGVLTFIPIFNQTTLHGFIYSAIFGFVIGPVPMSIMYIFSNPNSDVEHRTNRYDILADLHIFFLLFPGYALGMGVYYLFATTAHLEECEKLTSKFKDCNGPSRHLCCEPQAYHGVGENGVLINDCFLVGEGIIAVIIIVVLEKWLHKISTSWERFKKRRKNKNKISPGDEEDALYLENTTMEVDDDDYQVLIKKLDKRTNDIIMVKALRLAIKHSQCFGLLGARGSGTKTVLQMLAGVQNPTSGNVFIDKVDLYSQHNKYLSMLGYCANQNMLSEEMTGREIIRLIGTIRGVRKENLDELVVNSEIRFMLFAEMNKLVKNYDPGSIRKLSAAVALIGSPKVLLFEDPDMDLDPISRADIMKTIRTERGAKPTMILCSQNMDVCQANCDRVAILVDGQLKCVGSPEFLSENYCNGYSIIIQLIPEDQSFYDRVPEDPTENDGNSTEEAPGTPSDTGADADDDDDPNSAGNDDTVEAPRFQSARDSIELRQTRKLIIPKISIQAADDDIKFPFVVYDPERPAGGPKEAGFRLRPTGSGTSLESNSDDPDKERLDQSSITSMVEALVPWQVELLPVMSYFETKYPDAQLVDTYPCFAHYYLPGEVDLARLFGFMETVRIKYDLETYRVSVGSLEQLLLDYTRGQAPRSE